MVKLSDDELEAVMTAARPMLPHQRSAFLERMAAELAALDADAIGPGAVARLCRELQREHYAAPDLARGAGSPRSRAY